MITSNRSVIVLNGTSGHVTVEPEDEDRFILSAQEAVRACRNHQRAGEVVRAFKQEFLVPLRAWCEGHQGQVEGCYVPPPVGHLEVYVVGTSPRFDFALAGELSGLELMLVDRGWRVGVMYLPNGPDEYLLGHFNPEGAIRVYGQPQSAPG